MNTTIIILLVIFLGAVYLIWQYRRIKKLPLVSDNRLIKNLTDADFMQLTSKGVVVIDFWAAWCMPCKMLAPVLNELSEELNGKASICKLNVDENPRTSQKFGVRSIPTIVILKNGNEVDRIIGVKTKQAIRQKIEKYL
jgi:thioredoxin 1